VPGFSYDAVGQTRPAQEGWRERPAGYRRFERTVCVGRGSERWAAVAAAVLGWQLKIRSGFVVRPADGDVTARRSADGRVWLTVRSLTRPADSGWRWVFPVLLIAQRFFRARYFRAVRPA
jgi:uncharacterized protein (UPF0548 family)